MATEELPLNLQNLRTDERDRFMDTRNYCIECDKPKPCECVSKPCDTE